MTETTIKKHIQFGEPISPDTAQGGFGFIPNGIREKNIFFYHPDHLGSSSYITGNDGKVSQHTEYIAFGEILFDEHNTEHTMPYLFNGKELDSETGLYYYGARYYDPRVSLWLNVDPLTEKYPHVSPYTYSLNNPINLIDPTGMKPEDPPAKRILAVFYHGGPTGDGQIRPSTKGTGGAGDRFNATAAYAKSKGLDFKGAVISPSFTQNAGVETGKDFINKNYKEGDVVIIYGYSYGGDNAVNLAEEISNIPINTMIIVDSSDGPFQGLTVDTSIPDNVDTAFNFFQENYSGASSSSRITGISSNSGGSNRSNKIDSGTSNSPGSRGYRHTSEGKAKVNNIKIVGDDVTHGNI